MVGSEHTDEPLLFVNGVEKPVIPDAIPPSLRYSISKFLDVLADVGVGS